ncbi:MAG: TIGR01244 family sulfur transferase [Pseudomonadota bacterium]
MVDFRRVTDTLYASPQIDRDDLARAAEAGIKTIICNRPDGEEIDQPRSADLKVDAEALGLTFLVVPFAGFPAPEIIAQQGTLIEQSPAPVLIYCRSGTRSVTAWALSQAGKADADTIIAQAASAGYDVSGLRAALTQ